MRLTRFAAILALMASPAVARVVDVSGSGIFQSSFTSQGGSTTVPVGAPLSIRFSFDTDDLELLQTDADFAAYRFATQTLTADIGDYGFQPAASSGTLVLSRGFGFFGGPSSERILVQSFSFTGLAAGAPFFLPAGLGGTNLSLDFTFRYGSELPPLDPGLLVDPALAARGSTAFAAIPVSGPARAVVFGPATGAFVTAAVPEPAAWMFWMLGFGVIGGLVRKGRGRSTPLLAAAVYRKL